MKIAKSNPHKRIRERTTGLGRLTTVAERLNRPLTAGLDAAESEPLRVGDQDGPDAEGDP